MIASFDQTNLKRNKKAFQSTAFQSMQSNRTIPGTYHKSQSLDPGYCIKMDYKSTVKINNQHISKQPPKIQTRLKIQQIAYNIAEERKKNQRELNFKSVRHFYYKGISRSVPHILLNVPSVVIQEYYQQNRKRQSLNQDPVAYTHGFLKNINCVYYAIKNKIIFIKIEDLLDCTDPLCENIPYVIYEVRNQVINIVQLVGQNLLFPNYSLILAVIHPWEIQFYAWQSSNIVKAQIKNINLRDIDHPQLIDSTLVLKPLNCIYKLPIQTVKTIDYSSDGRIFFFDANGYLYQITPKQQKQLFIFNTGRYIIKNYVNNSHNTFQILSRKHSKFSSYLFNGFSKAGQLVKYLFPSKVEALSLFCDNKRGLLFALLKKYTKLLFGSQSQTFIVCYQIKFNQKAKLIYKFSEQFFIQTFGIHQTDYMAHDFLFHSIHPAPSSYENANLIIITKSGMRFILQISQNNPKMHIIERICPLSHQMFGPTAESQNYNSIQKSQTQFSPAQFNTTQIQSVFLDEQNVISVLSHNETNQLVTYITPNTNTIFEGAADINQQANQINMQIFQQGQRKVSIYMVDQSKIAKKQLFPNFGIDSLVPKGLHAKTQAVVPNNYLPLSTSKFNSQNFNQYKSNTSQLTSQTILAPSVYLFMAQNKIQLLSQLRPIDIVFTTLCLISEVKTPKKYLSVGHMSKNLSVNHYNNNLQLHNKNNLQRQLQQRLKQMSQSILIKLFVSGKQSNIKTIQQTKFSLICNTSISTVQLCSMLLQIVVDEAGVYYYSELAAEQILDMFQSEILGSRNNFNRLTDRTKERSVSRQNRYNSVRQDKGYSNLRNSKLNRKVNIKNLKQQNFYTFSSIPSVLLSQCKKILSNIQIRGSLQKLTSNLNSVQKKDGQIFYNISDKLPVKTTVNTNQDTQKQSIIRFKISVVTKYISYLLDYVWNIPIIHLQSSSYGYLRNVLIQKLASVQKYIRQQESQFKIYAQSNISSNAKSLQQKASLQLYSVAKKCIELLTLVQSIDLLNLSQQHTFLQLLRSTPQQRYYKQLQQCLFTCIHRQYRYTVVNKWHQLFPAFVSQQFVKIVRLYGEIEVMTDRQLIVQELRRYLRKLNNVEESVDSSHRWKIQKQYPQYFMNYLVQIRKISKEQLYQDTNITNNNNKFKNKYKQNMFTNDFQFQIPTQIKALVDKYHRSSDNMLSDSDLQQIYSFLTNSGSDPNGTQQYNPCDQIKQSVQKLTISNKYSLVTFIIKHLPAHPSIQYLSKCISTQYDMYMHYLKTVQANNKKEKHSDKQTKYNQQTMQLLRFHIITDKQKLQKLVWTTGNLFLILGFCATFHTLADQKQILVETCQSYQKYAHTTAFQQFIHRYILNIAIKSQFSTDQLRIICQVLDRYLQSLPTMKDMLGKWMTFNKISSITDKHIWLPQCLIKIGYSPQVVFSIFAQQLQQVYSRQVSFQDQYLYGLKILDCYVVVNLYLSKQGHRHQLIAVLNKHIDGLVKKRNIKENVVVGLRKMIDTLLSKN